MWKNNCTEKHTREKKANLSNSDGSCAYASSINHNSYKNQSADLSCWQFLGTSASEANLSERLQLGNLYQRLNDHDTYSRHLFN